MLTKNLKLNLGASAGTCITVAADYVTIDLGGFTISCGGDTNAFGIIEGSSGNFKGIIIRNGFITGDCYVALVVSSSTGILADHLSTISNSSTGMALGSGSLVVRSIANDNAAGILAYCPSNAIYNAALNNQSGSLTTSGFGCNLFNNLAP